MSPTWMLMWSLLRIRTPLFRHWGMILWDWGEKVRCMCVLMKSHILWEISVYFAPVGPILIYCLISVCSVVVGMFISHEKGVVWSCFLRRMCRSWVYMWLGMMIWVRWKRCKQISLPSRNPNPQKPALQTFLTRVGRRIVLAVRVSGHIYF